MSFGLNLGLFALNTDFVDVQRLTRGATQCKQIVQGTWI